MSGRKYTPTELAIVQHSEIPFDLKRISQAATVEELNFAMALVVNASAIYYELGAGKLVPNFIAAASTGWKARLNELLTNPEEA